MQKRTGFAVFKKKFYFNQFSLESKEYQGHQVIFLSVVIVLYLNYTANSAQIDLISGEYQLIKILDCPSGGKWDLCPIRRIWKVKGIYWNWGNLVHPHPERQEVVRREFFRMLGEFLIPYFSSVTQLCSTLCDPMDCSMPGFPVHHQLPELAQTHVHRVNDAIQPFHPLLSPSPPAFNLSQHQGLFKWLHSSN